MTKLALLFSMALCFCASHTTAQTVRVAAEWEEHEATWMQWPRSFETSYQPNFANIIGALQAYETVNILVRNASSRTQAEGFLQAAGVPLTNIRFHIMPYNWAWMRDNGPVWVEVDGEMTVQDWGFDGWGGIATPWGLDDAVPCLVASALGLACNDHAELIMERGSVEFNGIGTAILSWPVQRDRNPGWTKAQMEAVFMDAWGVSKITWLLSAPEDDEFTGGHVDGIARFINPNTVVVARQADQNHPDAWVYDQAADIIETDGFQVVRLDIPGMVVYRGVPMSANPINWLVANGVVVVPGFDHPEWDAQAKAQIEGFFPDRDVKVVEVLEIWYWGGGVHCVTNDQPALSSTECIADWNQDGTVNTQDFLAFLNAWAAQDESADLDNDGTTDINDLLLYLNLWAAGC
ncbi:agmatine deiminase family protein [bacterium AH-315-K20]|nr:agmatine deiminase family protein [bacterium AH-315-K20]